LEPQRAVPFPHALIAYSQGFSRARHRSDSAQRTSLDGLKVPVWAMKEKSLLAEEFTVIPLI